MLQRTEIIPKVQLSKSYSRLMYVDFLKVISCSLVVMTHISAEFGTLYGINSVEFYIGVILNSLSRIAVPVFIMVSGMLFLEENKKISTKKMLLKYVLNILFLYFFWSVFYSLNDTVIIPLMHKEKIPYTDFIHRIFKGKYHLWYLKMIVGLYIFTPVLRLFVKKQNKNLILYMLIVLFGFSSVLPTIFYIIKELTNADLSIYIADFKIDKNLMCFFYFILGWYIKNVKISKKFKLGIYALGVVSAIMTPIIIIFMSKLKGTPSYNIFSNDYVFTALFSLAVVVFVSTYAKKEIAFLKNLATKTFGIYMLHVFILEILNKFIPYKGAFPLIYIISKWFLTLISSYAVVCITSKIPIVKKIMKA